MGFHVVAIDDDSALIDTVRRLLTRVLPGAIVHTETNPILGMRYLRDHPEVQVVLLDVCMPLLNGQSAAAWVRYHRPELALVAWTADERAIPFLGAIGCPVLSKRDDPRRLVAHLQQLQALRGSHAPPAPEHEPLLRAMAQQVALLIDPGVVMVQREVLEQAELHLNVVFDKGRGDRKLNLVRSLVRRALRA
jgi:DNA-binding NarL/FixJ family response regulator